MKKVLMTLIAALLLFGGTFSDASAEVTEQTGQVYIRLIFGLGVGSGSVNPDIARDFIEKEVASRFPQGLSLESAVLGQWMSSKGLIREKNLAVSIATNDSEETYKKIKEIGELFTKRFASANASLFVVPLTAPRTLHYKVIP